MTIQSSIEINPEFRVSNVQNLIVEMWQSSTNSDWRKTQASLITLLKIADGDFFIDLLFLIDIASERQGMSHIQEMTARGFTHEH